MGSKYEVIIGGRVKTYETKAAARAAARAAKRRLRRWAGESPVPVMLALRAAS